MKIHHHITTSLTLTLAAIGGLVLGSTAAHAAIIGQLGVLDSSTGLSPGDQYRLVFVTSGTTTGASTDIATYNAFVQGAATTAGLGGVTWNVIGSTGAVDARDNTGTDPGATIGVPIYLTDGTTLIAANNASLWDGAIDAFIDLDENGAPRLNDRILTGTDGNGTGAGDGRVLGGSTEDPSKVQTGRNNLNLGGWVRNFNQTTTANRPVYGLSDPLTVVPEPSSLALLGLAGLALLRRRRR